MKSTVLCGKPDVEESHVRFDEKEVESAETKRGGVLYKKPLRKRTSELGKIAAMVAFALCGVFFAHAVADADVLAEKVGIAAAAGCAAKPERVVFIGFDGLGSVAFEKGVKAPNIRRLMAEGSWSLDVRTVLPSVSYVNWASVFTCVPPELHGFTTFDGRKPQIDLPCKYADGRCPDLFGELRKARPDIRIDYCYEWGGMGDFASTNACDFIGFADIVGRDAITNFTGVAAGCIRRDKPQFAAIVYGEPDGAGHKHGWFTKEYMDKVEWLDAELGKLLDALAESGYTRDNTVLVLTSDHGGNDHHHGLLAMSELRVPLVIWGKGVKRNHQIKDVTVLYDVGATLAELLEVPAPQVWRGRPVADAFVGCGKK